MKISFAYILVSTFLLFLACKKKEVDYSPKITLASMQPLQVKEFKDSVQFIIKYEDADGDIGIPDADKNSFWIKDRRLDSADGYFIAPVGPLDKKLSIEGTFTLNLKNTFKLGNAPKEKTSFQIWLKDRAGNKSNVVETPELIITK